MKQSRTRTFLGVALIVVGVLMLARTILPFHHFSRGPILHQPASVSGTPPQLEAVPHPPRMPEVAPFAASGGDHWRDWGHHGRDRDHHGPWFGFWMPLLAVGGLLWFLGKRRRPRREYYHEPPLM